MAIELARRLRPPNLVLVALSKVGLDVGVARSGLTKGAHLGSRPLPRLVIKIIVKHQFHRRSPRTALPRPLGSDHLARKAPHSLPIHGVEMLIYQKVLVLDLDGAVRVETTERKLHVWVLLPPVPLNQPGRFLAPRRLRSPPVPILLPAAHMVK